MKISETEQYIERFCSMLKSDKLKCTNIRQDILKVFFINKHFCAEEIFNHLKESNIKTSRQSVYSTIKLLLSYKIIRQYIKDSTSYYELSRKGNHFHLQCVRCCELTEYYDPQIHSHVDIISKKNNFQNSNYEIILYGLCKACNIDNQ